MKPDTVSILLKIIAQKKRLKLSKSFHLEKKKMNNPKRKLRKLSKQFHLLYHQKNKVFKDNLTKKEKTHTPEDCKMLLKEILKDTNKWKTNLRSWTGRYKTVKMSILSKVTYRCNAICIEIFNRFPPKKQKYPF